VGCGSGSAAVLPRKPNPWPKQSRTRQQLGRIQSARGRSVAGARLPTRKGDVRRQAVAAKRKGSSARHVGTGLYYSSRARAETEAVTRAVRGAGFTFSVEFRRNFDFFFRFR